ncbi:hypothetical protein FACS1894141_6230 [Spirochaetia bacterium]|nr:hypothetical protein FACS1894141_6230 [Spirochaetia bacterium]
MSLLGTYMIQCAYRFNCPLEIEEMTFSQLRFWYDAARAMTEAEKAANKK